MSESPFQGRIFGGEDPPPETQLMGVAPREGPSEGVVARGSGARAEQTAYPNGVPERDRAAEPARVGDLGVPPAGVGLRGRAQASGSTALTPEQDDGA